MTAKPRTVLLALACLTALAPGCAPAGGRLDDDLVRRIVQAHLPEARRCYDAIRTTDAAAAGVVAVDLTIGEDGEVADVVVFADDFAGTTMDACIRETVDRWIFPRPDGGPVTVSYPFVFLPRDPRSA
jgi:hypothetical protein